MSPYHFLNPYLSGDLLGEVLGRLHDLDITPCPQGKSQFCLPTSWRR